MNTSVALPFVAVFLASIIAGCGAAGNVATTGATPVPSPSGGTCTPPPGYTVQMVFPQNGQTGQANLQGVVFAVGPSPQPGGVPSPLPTNWFVYAVSALGTTYGTSSVSTLATPVPAPGSTAGSTPTPLPTPSDAPSPGFTNYIYETASIGTFANSTQFTIYLANTNCYPGIATSTFTTASTDLPSPTPSPTGT